jgi:ElaB/YqjD/DUF883 family membrane-anchored ribosome-binding protein
MIMEKIGKSADGDLIEKTFPQADDAIRSVKVKGDEYWQTAKEKGRHFWRGAQARQREKWSEARAFVQKNPGKSVGYAALLGAVLTILLFPKNRD